MEVMGPAALLILSLAWITATWPPLTQSAELLGGAQLEHAELAVHNELKQPLTLTWVSSDCFQCVPRALAECVGGRVSRVAVDSTHAGTLALVSSGGELCRMDVWLGELGEFSLRVERGNLSSNATCGPITTTRAPVNSSLPVLIAAGVLLLLSILFPLSGWVLRLRCVQSMIGRVLHRPDNHTLLNNEAMVPPQPQILPPNATTATSTQAQRLRSLDTFRGISIVLMVFVNYGGGKYWYFKHSAWNGLTVADLVFPWFVFALGSAVGLSTAGPLRRGRPSRLRLSLRALWRSLLLFLIGIFIVTPNYCHGPLVWSELRVPGVLQRLAVANAAVSLLEIYAWGPHHSPLARVMRWPWLRDLLPFWPQWLLVGLLQVAWLSLTLLLPVPGCMTGYLGPGGIGSGGSQANCTGGAAGYIDRWLLTDRHLYQTPTTRNLYRTTVPYDPEGILGTLNVVLSAFLGLQAARTVLSFPGDHRGIVRRFLLWAALLGVISAVLTKCTRDEGFLPVNKNLWSTSFVTVTACFAFLLLAALHLATDALQVWTGTPFHYAGMNPLLLYVGHELLASFFPFRWGAPPAPPAGPLPHAWPLAQNLVACAIWVVVAWRLHHHRLYLKL
ncbi:heparan-alpha-glucosaminide N-acetyltransferase isoform X1 [Lethenteron reissneri]|uniref:heparan-alpha-glucosaminide N-acetyltransferase isoform X1 n=2 Tax=Lethenteron reissneri TaxID=7753 RepID=UPI002AB69BED|nr:heparan-alpha-glucosaminide N-acetyltransferase isoform X1 [Lethenteron reissneri]